MRIFYCPKHGRVTEEQYEMRCCVGYPLDLPYAFFDVYACDHCFQWYHRVVPYKAKRQGES